jgi:hypothetical protein
LEETDKTGESERGGGGVSAGAAGLLTIPQLVETARLLGLQLSLEAGQLKAKAGGPPCPVFLALLRANKNSVALWLSAGGAKNKRAEGLREYTEAGKAWRAHGLVQRVEQVMKGSLVAWAERPEPNAEQGGLF